MSYIVDYADFKEALLKADIKTLKSIIIEHPKFINSSDITTGYSPLMWACVANDLEFVKYLVENGAYVNKLVTYKETPLACACVMNSKEVIEYLVEHGADVNLSGPESNTPLIEACSRGYKEIAEYLVEHGADVNKSGRYNTYPLGSACESGNKELVEYLISLGADINECAIDSACRVNDEAIIKCLFEHGAKSRIDDFLYGFSSTPLIIACENGAINVVKYLVENGADLSIIGNQEGTALDVAMKKGNKEIVEYLHGCLVKLNNKDNGKEDDNEAVVSDGTYPPNAKFSNHASLQSLLNRYDNYVKSASDGKGGKE